MQLHHRGSTQQLPSPAIHCTSVLEPSYNFVFWAYCLFLNTNYTNFSLLIFTTAQQEAKNKTKIGNPNALDKIVISRNQLAQDSQFNSNFSSLTVATTYLSLKSPTFPNTNKKTTLPSTISTIYYSIISPRTDKLKNRLTESIINRQKWIQTATRKSTMAYGGEEQRAEELNRILVKCRLNPSFRN